MKEQARARARQLAQECAQRGDATGWFEELYTRAQGNEQAIHWADLEVNPSLVAWLDRRNIQGKGKRALVVGCGLGDDAEELARRGFEVVAFDIAPTAIAWCRLRFPQCFQESKYEPKVLTQLHSFLYQHKIAKQNTLPPCVGLVKNGSRQSERYVQRVLRAPTRQPTLPPGS